jgi:8-oxo-dGTP pyrophosphatase MutT (NUDIX family)
LTDEEPSTVEVRDASTVLLLRDSPVNGQPETWMMTRVTQMAFAAGASVFPGGRVDETDADLPWSGRPAQIFADELGCDVDLAHALVAAAVRETFEETGVLLTSPPASLAHARSQIEDRQLTFGALLSEHKLAIDADALRPWSRWITPAGRGLARRFDTRFFVAKLPAGAEAANLTSESVVATWMRPEDVLAEADRGERLVMAPTRTVLWSVGQYASVDEILAGAAGRSLDPVTPQVEVDDEGQSWFVMPDGYRFALNPPAAPNA